jgi:raffinose/stachyose/melibiose transport system substrate-binding protein
MHDTSATHRKRRRFGPIGALVLSFALVLSACADDGAGSDTTTTDETTAGEDITLRLAMGSPGEAQIAVWEATKAAFEDANPNVTVELNFQEDDLYETIGLPNLLNSGDAPDVYFEWAGARLQSRYDEGFVADITDAVDDGELGTYFEEGAFNGMVIDGKNVMVPSNADVTTVMWYNVDIFEDLGLSVPTDWGRLLEVSQTIADAGTIPIAVGNKDLWPVGNWTSHMVSRVIGEDTYHQMLTQEVPLDSPEVIEALGYIADLGEAGIVNESANAIDDNEGAQLFFQGQAAMHPIGSWLVSWAIEEAPDLNFDYFNLPTMAGAGTQDSVIAVSTGFVVNDKSEHKDVAIDFLTLFSSPEFTAQMVDAGGTPLATGAMDREDIDPRLLSLMQLMQEAGALVAPPDTGYDLVVADALYAAEAEVLGGVATPEEAAATAQAKLDQ